MANLVFNLVMDVRYLLNKIIGTWRRRWVKVGLVVYDCSFDLHRVVKLDRWNDDVTLDDGSEHSIDWCLDSYCLRKPK